MNLTEALAFARQHEVGITFPSVMPLEHPDGSPADFAFEADAVTPDYAHTAYSYPVVSREDGESLSKAFVDAFCQTMEALERGLATTDD